MPATSNASGMLLLVVSMGLFSLSDALVQYAGAGLSPLRLAWLRYCLLLLSVLPLLARRPRLARTRHPWVQAARALCLVGSALLFLQGLKTLAIADATALVFASPLYVTVLAALLLRERHGLVRNLPVLLGFAGVLVIAQPGGAQFQSAYLFPMSSSLAWAVAVICTRFLSAGEASATTMLYSATLGLLLLSPVVQPGDWRLVAAHWPALTAMALAWCAAQWLVLLAYRQAAPAAIAPFSYTQLLWAGLLGWGLFGQLPSARTTAGMAIILCSGLMAAWVSRRTQPHGRPVAHNRPEPP